MLCAGKRGNGDTHVEGLGGGEVGVDGVLGVLLGGDVEHHEDVLVLHLVDELVVVARRYHHRVIGIGDKARVLRNPLQLRSNRRFRPTRVSSSSIVT